MTTHTKGPWTIKESTSSAMVSVYAGGFSVACTGSAKAEDDNARANARLISAAPDLLAACEAVISELDGDPHRYSLCNTVAAAIAKAKGEA